MGIGKGLCLAAAAVFAGFVGYKIVQKKNPELITKVKGSFSDAGRKLSDILSEAGKSFHEGYAQG